MYFNSRRLARARPMRKRDPVHGQASRRARIAAAGIHIETDAGVLAARLAERPEIDLAPVAGGSRRTARRPLGAWRATHGIFYGRRPTCRRPCVMTSITSTCRHGAGRCAIRRDGTHGANVNFVSSKAPRRAIRYDLREGGRGGNVGVWNRSRRDRDLVTRMGSGRRLRIQRVWEGARGAAGPGPHGTAAKPESLSRLSWRV